MVELFNFQAWQFHTGIERIRAAFRAAVAAIEAEEVGAQEAYDRYIASGQDDREYDEDRILTHSTEVSLEFASREAVLATQAVRQAFAMSIFHYWERSARAWTRWDRPGFPSLKERMEGQGIRVDERLELLNNLNNLLKHDSARSGGKVFEDRPDLFMWRRRPTGRNWQASVVIANCDIEEFLDAIARSGPAFP
jgi:hypothetical protein